jgi:hypothetical protein
MQLALLTEGQDGLKIERAGSEGGAIVDPF